MGYKEREFLNAYNEIRGTQNNEIVDSNPLAFVLKKFVESICNTSEHSDPIENKSGRITLFNGTPLRLLQELNPIAINEGIDISQKDWPKNRNWLIRKINIVKPTLKQAFGIEIAVVRDSTNSSTIRIEKNMSGISGEHEISPDNSNLSPFFEKISPGLNDLSPALNPELSTISTKSGDTGYTGDNKATTNRELVKTELSESIEENVLEKEMVFNKTQNNDLKALEYEDITLSNDEKSETNYKIYPDSRKADHKIDPSTLENDPDIGYKSPFYFCRKHPKIQNIHLQEIIDHLKLSSLHK
jgi:hypothetical protein